MQKNFAMQRGLALQIRKGMPSDLDAISALYDELNDYLEAHTNYCCWKKGVYPTREDALRGIRDDSAFVAEEDGRIVGTFILRHEPEKGYDSVDWQNDLSYDAIYVVYTFAVHPEYLKHGIGSQMLQFIGQYARQTGMKAIRLDVYEENIPAIKLYEKSGFEYMGTADLGYSVYGLGNFKLFQMLV